METAPSGFRPDAAPCQPSMARVPKTLRRLPPGDGRLPEAAWVPHPKPVSEPKNKTATALGRCAGWRRCRPPTVLRSPLVGRSAPGLARLARPPYRAGLNHSSSSLSRAAARSPPRRKQRVALSVDESAARARRPPSVSTARQILVIECSRQCSASAPRCRLSRSPPPGGVPSSGGAGNGSGLDPADDPAQGDHGAGRSLRWADSTRPIRLTRRRWIRGPRTSPQIPFTLLRGGHCPAFESLRGAQHDERSLVDPQWP